MAFVALTTAPRLKISSEASLVINISPGPLTLYIPIGVETSKSPLKGLSSKKEAEPPTK